MEELWKKYKRETQEHIEKINKFLNETSSNEKSQLKEPEKIIKNEMSQISEQIIIEDKTSENVSQKKKHLPRKKIYGKLKDVVKEIMEKENVSRAQAYRKAKKRFLENSQ